MLGNTNEPIKDIAANGVNIGQYPLPLAIDIFSGGGGLSAGFESAGFHIAQGIENSPYTAATYRRNHPDTLLIEEDISTVDPHRCLQKLNLESDHIFALIGGPPCQGYSESNRRTRTLDNPRNHLYEEYLRFLNTIRPAWFVFENVAGLRTLANGAILSRIMERCQRLGYDVDWAELDAADYGVPQHRRRIFIIGNNIGIRVPFPKPTHGTKGQPHITVADAISDLPVLANGASIDYLCYRQHGRCLTEYQRSMRGKSRPGMVQGNLVTRNSDIVLRRYSYIGPGQNWEAVPAELLNNYKDFSRCHTGIYYRLENANPAKVIGNFRKNMLIHPEQDRGLSIREAARLQSFPDNHVFLGSIGFQQQQVADAVPPLLAAAVAQCILDAMKSG